MGTPDFESELVDCIIGISPDPHHMSLPNVRILGKFAQEISEREWFDDVTQSTINYELPILCDRDFYHQLPVEATDRKTLSANEEKVSHASEVKGGTGKSHRWRVQQTLHSAHLFMDQVGLEWPILVGHYKEIDMIRKLAIDEGLDPIVPPDLPSHFGEEHHSHHGWNGVHVPGFLKFR